MSTRRHTTLQPPDAYYTQLACAADRLFLYFGLILGLASLTLAVWSGQWLPFYAVSVPVLALMTVQVKLAEGSLRSRVTVALALMALVAATIQQAGGAAEAHFGVFVVLALLLYYRDWVPVVVAAAAISVHHLVFHWLQARGLPSDFIRLATERMAAINAAYAAIARQAA